MLQKIGAFSTSHRLPNKNPSVQCGLDPLNLPLKGVLETSKQYRLLLLLDCSPELDGKTLLLKIIHTLTAEHGGT